MPGTEKEKNRSGTEKEKKRSGTEKEKNRSGTEKEKKRSATEKEKNRSGTEKEKKRSATEKEKNRSGTEKEKKRSATEKEKNRSGTEKGKKRKELTEAHASPKKTVNDEIVVCELGTKRKVSVKHWNEGIRIDIREYYLKDGKQRPTTKGTSLTMSELMMVRNHIGKIDNALNEDS